MSLREKLHEIIFEADTPAGKAFDIILLLAILLSVGVVMLESVDDINKRYEHAFDVLEWSFTILFTLEYILRILIINKPLKYIFSFYGIIDLLSILPTYMGIFVKGTSSLMIVRSLRLLRVFRVLKLTRYLGEGNQLWVALLQSRRKILVFLFVVLTASMIMGTLMFMIEGPEHGFTSIPRSIYWAIVTLTTVGYGDISPSTAIGQFFASVIMVLGYGIIAVPTGIVTAELVNNPPTSNTQVCRNCAEDQHVDGATYCHSCGHLL
ncbi:MAG: ion transporter [Bacteroidetes bacterium]|nr:ion transporter [Bacteroidota bacterium]